MTRQLQWGALLLIGALTGCGGCFSNSEDKLTREELEKRRKEQKDAIQIFELVSLPRDSETKLLTVKPGHWHETIQQFKSNREDLQVVVTQAMTRGNEPTVVPGTNTINEYTRRTSLPKGQTKTVELQTFVPGTGGDNEADVDPFSLTSRRLQFSTNLLSWPLMTPILQSPVPKPANELKNHEFQLLAMGPQALSYEYLSVLDAVLWRQDEQIMDDQRIRSYYVALVKPDGNRYEIPHSFLTMTSVAVIVWDDVAPDDLTVDQQTALIDWLHWGGQLLVSGPNSWSRLQTSFLSPYLPATSAETTELTTESFAELSDHWVVEDMSSRRANREPLDIVGPPMAGLRFQLSERGQWLPHAGQTVAESQVGRGRVVLTSFALREPRVYRWKYFGSFFSTGLLRRPPRTVVLTSEERALVQTWAPPLSSRNRDPRLHSKIRILSRDLVLGTASPSQALTRGEDFDALWGSDGSEQAAETATNDGFEPAGLGNDPSLVAAEISSIPASSVDPPLNSSQEREELSWSISAASWNDSSGLCSSAYSALQSAAGIELPSRKTIIYLLGGYLLCLVPLNWLVFRSIRRLEFAWVAAPIMALVGVVVVTRVASLDIGFARRTTEIAVLELHGDYPRAHLTKFLALYTSLSTNYTLDFPEKDSVALPFEQFGTVRSRAAALTKNLRTAYGQSDGTRLEPVTVYSNSTEMLHAEQIVALPGGMSLGETSSEQPAIRNQTGLNLRSALAIRCVDDGTLEQVWLGDLPDGAVATLAFNPVAAQRVGARWLDDFATRPTQPSAEELVGDVDSLWVGGILNEIAAKSPWFPGQMRLLGFTDDRPGSLSITPVEDQFDARCVVVAHLTHARLGEVRPDAKILGRVVVDSDAASELPELVEPDEAATTNRVLTEEL